MLYTALIIILAGVFVFVGKYYINSRSANAARTPGIYGSTESPVGTSGQKPEIKNKATPTPGIQNIIPHLFNKTTPTSQTGNHIKTVFVIVMENQNWSGILNNPSAPYINNTLLPQASYAQNYHNPKDLSPSEPNYIWLEAGKSLGINNDEDPSSNHQSTTDHLVTYLEKAGITWKSYQEDISGKQCPLTSSGLYAARHNPFVYFNDVTNNLDPNSKNCIAHIRPYDELKHDLATNNVAQYNFIAPNLCHDMHNTDGCDSKDPVKNGDTWLSKQIPMIMNSDAYKNGGVIFITWDEDLLKGKDDPIGMIVLSPLAKGGGYTNNTYYTHSSTLRTIEEIFNIQNFLGDSANAPDLKDLFTTFP